MPPEAIVFNMTQKKSIIATDMGYGRFSRGTLSVPSFRRNYISFLLGVQNSKYDKRVATHAGILNLSSVRSIRTSRVQLGYNRSVIESTGLH